VVQATPLLTRDEEVLIRQAFMRGPAALADVGYGPDELAAFIRRPAVRARLDQLNQEYTSREESEIRTRFMVRRKLAGCALDAADVLVGALEGPLYEKCGDNLWRLASAPPTDAQVEVARDILDRLGCRTFDRTMPVVDGGQIVSLLAQAAETATVRLVEEEGKSPVERALGRERVRVAMEKLRGILSAERTKVLEAAAHDPK
jgi:hypothetical protein